ncbi:MAG: PQQ-binding-like beta-propeller repeat protein [bacterium]|nr:PQQ-binding-like beta-propeller repeat protein [bacterium]
MARKFGSVRLLAVIAVALCATALPGQSPTFDNSPFDDQQFLEGSRRDGEDPGGGLGFIVVHEIPLPGPLPGESPRIDGELAGITVSGGEIRFDWREGRVASYEALLEEAPEAAVPADAWSVSRGETHRYGPHDRRWIVAQKACKRCKRGWKRVWKLRVPGSTVAPPLVTDKRVFFGALDNRVYAVKRRNGHRVWAVDLEGRASRRLIALSDLATQDEQALLLAVPGHGTAILALDMADGSRKAAFRLEENDGRIVGVPVPTPDGHILVARQKYRDNEASLLVLRLGRLPEIEPATEPEAAPEPPVAYNGGRPETQGAP